MLLTFAQGVAIGIVLSFERHQDCNLRFKIYQASWGLPIHIIMGDQSTWPTGEALP